MWANETLAAILGAIADSRSTYGQYGDAQENDLSILGRERLAGAELCPIELRDVGQLLLAFAREHHLNPSTVAAIPEALQKPALGHPIYQTYRSVVLNQQEICKFTHRHIVMRPGQPLYRKQRLILL